MANLYNYNPIVLDSTMASGWRALQTLNIGTITLTSPSGVVTTVPAQRGLWVTKVIWENPTTVGHTFSISDPNVAATVLLAGACGVAGQDVEYDFVNAAQWRDFKLTHLDSGKIFIWYR